MNVKQLMMGLVMSMFVVSTVVIADEHEYDLTLPTDPKPGQCFVPKLYPPTFKVSVDKIVIQPLHKTFTVTPPVFEEKDVVINVADAYDTFTPVRPTFIDDTIRIQIAPAFKYWSKKCCKKKSKCHYNKCNHGCGGGCGHGGHGGYGHGEYGSDREYGSSHGYVKKKYRHKGPCLQICYKEKEAKYKVFNIKRLDKDGSFTTKSTPRETITIKRRTLVTPATTKEITIPGLEIPVTITVETTPARMVWVKGYCGYGHYKCNYKHLQQKLYDAGYYKGEIDGVVGPNTMDALNAYRDDNELELSEYVDEVSAKALGL